jgi:intracellular sulfur oxidation DsrE/DsrF family protein
MSTRSSEMPRGISDATDQPDGVGRRRRRLSWLLVLLALVAATAFVLLVRWQHRQPDPRLEFPRIHGAGGILPVSPGALLPSATADHRLLVDIDSAERDRSGHSIRLQTAAKILNLYAAAGVPADKVHMALLLYGHGVEVALGDGQYRARFHRPNPDAALLAQLQRAGVSTIACGQALGHQAITAADLQPGVRLALSALTEREELETAGYRAVPKEPH